jgi:hypothetical protein
MTSADLAAQRTAGAAALEAGAGEDTLLAFHHEMSGDARASLFCLCLVACRSASRAYRK